jgi:phospholipid/cholesterol/gamma-HCH transport system substrate-binding protein
MKREFKVGLFLAIALFILATVIFIVGDLTVLFRKSGYVIYADFETAAGLEKRTIVKMAGVSIGYVKDIQLKGVRAELAFSIDAGVEIYKDSQAAMASLGLLGEKYIEIVPGQGPDICQQGDTIGSIAPVSFDQLGGLVMSIGDDIKEVSASLRELIGGEEPRSNFHSTLKNLSNLTQELKEFTEANKNTLTKSIKASSQTIKNFDQRVEDIARNMDELIMSVRNMVDDSRDSVDDSLEKISELIEQTRKAVRLLTESMEKINRGEGTVGKLIHDEALYDRTEGILSDVERMAERASSFRIKGNLRLDYYAKNEMIKGYLTLSLWPTADKYFLGQIIHDPFLDRFTYSAQGGMRFGNFSPRAGIMESEFGVGLDYYALRDRLRLSLESYDFNRDPRPQFRIFASFYASKYLYILLGVNDFSISSNREMIFGLGIGL